MTLRKKHSQQGSALLMVVIVMLILVGISFAYMTISYLNSRKAAEEADALQALYIAESAVGAKITEWNVKDPVSGTRPAPAPINTMFQMAGGAYLIPTGSFVDFATATPSDPNYISFQVVTWYPFDWNNAANQAYVTQVNALYAGGTATQPPPPPNKTTISRKMDILLSRAGGGVYWNAVFAGNSSGAAYNGVPYSLNLAGANGAGDSVWGNIYSGGNFSAQSPASFADSTGVSGTQSKATIAGTASGSASGLSTTSGTEPSLSINRNTDPTKGPLGQTDWERAIATLGSGNRDPNTGIAYVDVAGDLNSRGTAGSWNPDGSSAQKQIANINDPSHIFRENPTMSGGSTANRTSAYEYTNSAKNDYYLEDPTNSSVTHQTLSGVPVNGDTTASALNVQSNGNNAVYFVDGNLRVSGQNIKSYQLTPAAGVGNLKMTMVVKGNVSMTDNVLYPTWQSKTDSLAIVAIQDPAFPNTTAADFQRSGTATLPQGSGGMTIDQFVTQYNANAQRGINNGSQLDLLPTNVSTWTPQQAELASQEYNKAYGSGNVYFGDPGSGTVEHFEGFLYAENNFYATNLDSTTASGGTTHLEIFGNMTAGNQIKINHSVNALNYLNGVNYIPLKVKFDDAIMSGASTPPGLPATPGFGSGTWFIASSRQAP